MSLKLHISIIIYNDEPDHLDNLCNELKNQAKQTSLLMEIHVADEKHTSIQEAFQQAVMEAQGEYVCFLYSSTRITPEFGNTLGKEFFGNKLQKHDVVLMNSVYLNPKGEEVDYNRFENLSCNRSVDLNNDRWVFNYCPDCYLIRRACITDEFFAWNLTEESLLLGILELLESRRKLYYLHPVMCVLMRGPVTDSYNYQAQFNPAWYTQSIRSEWFPLLEKYPDSAYVQNTLFYLLKARFSCNWNDRNKNVIEGDEVTEFIQAAQDLLQKIPDSMITYFSPRDRALLPKFMCYRLLCLKYRNQDIAEKLYCNDRMFTGTLGETVIDSSHTATAAIWAINSEDGNLWIDGRIINTYYIPESDIKVCVRINGTNYDTEQNQIYALNKFFGISVNHDYTFIAKVPHNLIQQNTTVQIYLVIGEHNYLLPLSFSKIQAHLTNRFSESYWVFQDHVLYYRKEDKALVIEVATKKNIRRHELMLYRQYLSLALHDNRAKKVLLFRTLYWLTKRHYSRKDIWMTFDQLFKGGDNGEYFFRYVSDRKGKGNIDIYYVLNKTAPEYGELRRKYGRRVLVFNSLRHKLLSLHASMIFATRVDVKLYCGFGNELEVYFRGLFNAEITCLQHGLTIQRIAQYQNRLFDNTKLYFCVSPFERENLLHPVYGYQKEQLLMTGAPRYDGLISRDKRQILITPTWRRSVTAGTNSKGSMNEYSVNFKHTEYFRLYNTLINDPRLIACAKETGYKLIYLIHPILSPQTKDFTVNDYVQIIPESEVNYEKILSESSLMVTDYSGVQFDFAYMRKPLIYYHPDTLPPQYEAGGLQYDTMGFGPVCINNDSVVEQICNHMQRNCRMEDIYRNRVEDFFAYNDQNNCQRVYEQTLQYLKKKGANHGNHKTNATGNCTDDGYVSSAVQ